MSRSFIFLRKIIEKKLIFFFYFENFKPEFLNIFLVSKKIELFLKFLKKSNSFYF